MVAPVVQLGKSIIYSFHFVVANRLFFYNHCVFWVALACLRFQSRIMMEKYF